MRFLFCSLPAHGHAYPLIPTALAAREAGHEVLFATGKTFCENIRAFGLDAVDAGITISEGLVVANEGPYDRRTVTCERETLLRAQTFGAVLPRIFLEELTPVLRGWRPDLVVHDPANFGASLAAHRCGVGAVCHGYGLVVDENDAAIGECLSRFTERVGLPWAGGFARRGSDPYLDVYPVSLQGPQHVTTAPRFPQRSVAVDAPDSPTEPVRRLGARRGGSTLVYLTLGTGFGTASVLRQALDGLLPLGVDVVVSAGPTVDVRELGPVPDNVMLFDWVPQAAVLRRADLAVHHGGSGTTLAVLSAGLPQLIVPQGADQFVNTEAVVDGGAGLCLPPSDFSADAVGTYVRWLMDDTAVRTRTGEVAAEMAAMPSPAENLPVLEELAASGRGDRSVAERP
jgi:UDP:flavonoid glycosyltransferase YjiC (YdhE family)